MTDTWLPAGAIQIDKIAITSHAGKMIDIRSLVEEMSVYEDISKSFITAKLLITDSLALITQLPIIGQESMQISFKTPHSAFTKSVSVNLQIISIEKMVRTNTRNARYLLNCTSSEYIKDITTKIRKSYADMAISDIVKKVFTEFMNPDESLLEVSATEGTRTIVIPNMGPSNAMRFLAREAKSPDYPPSNFCFYQNVDGYFFKTIDEMIARPPSGTGPNLPIDNYFTTDFNTNDYDSPHSVGTTSGGTGGGSRQTTKPFEFLKMIDFQFLNLEQYDRITRVGGLESYMRVIDPALQYYVTKTYNYFNDYDKFKRTAKNVPQKFLLEGSNYLATGDSKDIFQITNQSQHNNYPPDQKVDFVQYDIASRGMLDNILLNVTIPGDSEKRVGQLVNLQFPEYGGQTSLLDKVNKFVSGSYLITACRHAYTQDGYKTSMLCVKNAFEEEIP